MADENAEATPAEEGESTPAVAEAKSGPGKSSMIIIIIVALLVVVATPLSTYLVIKNMAPDPVVAVEKQNINSGEQEIISIPSIIVNVAETKGTRILKLEVHLVVSEKQLAENLKDKKMPLIKDRIILAASRKTIDELEGAQGRELLKREIMSEVNAAIKGMNGSIVEVYFGDFLIQ